MYPTLLPGTFDYLGSQGVLSFGPPGFGKYLAMKSISKKYDLQMISLKISVFFSQWQGESEKYYYHLHCTSQFMTNNLPRLIDLLFLRAQQLRPRAEFIDE